jgi:LacI family transcriptional regulator
MVLSAAEAAGKKAGVDFGLIGFNDDVEVRALGITTLRPPLEELGREASRNLIRTLQGETIPVQIRLQSQLITRASTVQPPR